MPRTTRSLRSANTSTRADGRLRQDELPTLRRDYNFLRSDILDDDITFSRSSNATQRNSEGKICYAPHNYYVYSENFGHSDWSKQSLTITADTSVTDPFGGTGSFKAVKQGSLNHQRLYDGVARSGGAGETYTLSVYVRPTTSLIGLAITFVGADDVNKNITVTPNVWQRVSFSVTTTGSYSSIVPWIYPCGSSGDDDNSSGGDAHIFGAQFESNFLTTPTDYNKTDGAAYNGPRLDFDHAASLSKDITESNRLGLLLEEQKTNLQPNSSQWVVSTHSINNFNAVTNNFAISPTGARDAWRAECYDTGGAARHEFYTRYNKANATRYTHSLYIKPFGTVTHLKGSDEGSSSRAACFDLINCQVVSNGLSNEGATIEKITEDGWVRVSFTFVSVAATADSFLYWAVGDEASLVSGNSVFANYDPGKGQGVFVWGVQQEVQNLSSYIPTYGSTSVRSGDSAVVSGTNFSRFYKDGKGESWIVDAEDYEVQRTTGQQAAVIKVHEGGNTFLGFGKGFGGGVLNRPAVWYKDGVAGGDMIYNSNFGNSQQTIDKNASYKLGVALDVDDAAWIMNGHLLGSAQKDTSVPSLYSPTELRIGTSASHEYNGHIRRVRYYKKRITDAQLVKKTNTDFLLNKYQHVKAAHSLRQLKEESGNSPCVSVRRSYDNSEKSWTPNQVSNGELENFHKSEAQTTLPLNVPVEADEMVTYGDFTDLVTDGGFDNASLWSTYNATVTGSKAVFSSAPNGSFVQQNINAVQGRPYTVSFKVDSISAGAIKVRFPFNSSTINSTGTHKFTGVADQSSTQLMLGVVGTTTAEISEVSIIEGSWNINSMWNISNGGISYDDSGVGNINTAVTLKKGRTYTVAFDVTSGTTPYIWLGNSAGSYSYDGRAYATRNIGHHTETFTMTSDQTTLAFFGSTSGTAFTIDNLSLKEVNPIASGYSCRKIHSDYTGYAMRVRNNDDNIEAEVSFDENNEISLDSRVKATSMNLLPASENFGEFTLGASSSASNASSLTDPFGGNNAWELKGSSLYSYSSVYSGLVQLTTGKNYTSSCYMKAGTSTLTRFTLYDSNTSPNHLNLDINWSASGVPSKNTAGTSASVNNEKFELIGDGWYRISFNAPALNADGTQSLQIHPDRNATSKTVYAFGMQLEETVYEDTPSGSEISTNGTFDTDTDWTKQTGWSIGNGVASCDGTQTTAAQIYQTIPTVTVGKKYQVTYDVTVTAGSMDVRMQGGGGSTVGSARTTSGSYTETLTPTLAHSTLRIRGTADFEGTVDNISLKELANLSPKDYTQTPVISDAHNSTTATNLREFCGKENRLSYSEDFSYYSNDSNYLTVENLTGTTPIGNAYSRLTVNTNANAEKNLYLNQNFTIEAGETYVVSAYVRNNTIIDSSDGSNEARLFLQRNGSGTYEGTGVPIPISSEWQRVSVSHTFAHNQTGLRAKILGLHPADQGSIEVTGFQVNTNSLKDYQVTSGSPKTADCMVVNWYNQGGGGGGGEDATQDTASQQPRIVMGSELVTDNGKPSIRFDGIDDNLKIEGEPSLKSAFWYANVLEQNSSNDQSFAQVLYGTGSWAYAAYFTTSTNISYYGWYLDNGWRQGNPDPVMGNGHVMSQINSGTRDVYFNGNQTLNHATTTFTDGVGGMIGARDYGGGTHRNLDGNLSELLLYPSDMSNSRFQIEQNMTRHYDTSIMANGTFESTSKWTTNGNATINTSTNSATIDGTSQTSYIVQGFLKEGKTYILTFDVSSDNGTGNRWITNNLGGGGLYYNITGNGSKTVIFTHTNAHPNLFFTARNGGYFVVSNIKVQEYGTDGHLTKLFDQTGNNHHAVQSTAAHQPQIVSGGDLIKSGGHPAWEYADVVPQHNLEIIGMSNMTPDLFFVSEIADATEVIIPTSTASSYYGIVSQNGSTSSYIGPYGNAELKVNGTQINGAGGGAPNRQEVYNAVVGRKLVYHRSGSTASWPKVAIGHYNSSNSAANIVNTKFSELIWYNSEQSADNQSGIHSNMNSHYNIYS